MVWIKNASTRSYFRNLLASPMRHVAKKVGLLDAPESHQSLAHWVLSRYVTMDRKDVLEVGGGQSGEAALPFLKDGAASVAITGLDHVTEEKAVSQKLRFLRANALSLTDVFEPESFDVVYGLSIVEHIPSPQTFLNEVHKVLRPGGVAYLEGNPLWSSAKGHHLWVATWGGPYQHKATANYLFSSFPQKASTNPLPDWSHLLMSEQQMMEHLTSKALPKVDIDCIVDWVFRSDQVNRLSSSEIAKAYSTSRLIVLEANTVRSKVPPDVELTLRRQCGDGIDYGTRGISYVLLKQ